MEEYLLKCQSSQEVEEILERSFTSFIGMKNISTIERSISQIELHRIIASAISSENGLTLEKTIGKVVKNEKLHVLLMDIMNIDRRKLWRCIATQSIVFPSPPQCIDMNWHVSTKIASDAGHKNRDTNALIDITSQEMPTSIHVFPPLQHIALQADRAKVTHVVTELYKIRDELQLLQSRS